MYKLWVMFLCYNCAWCNLQDKNAQDTCDDCISILECKETSPYLNLTEENLRNIDRFICGITDYSFNVCCSKFNNFLTDKSHPNLKLLPDNCGNIFSIEDRIFSGTVSELNEFPWMVLIAYKDPFRQNGSTFKCSGTLINSRYVLTAAHCVHNADIASVRVGEHQIGTDIDCKDNVCVTNTQDIEVNETIIHENFNPFDNNANDIALLRLAQNVNLTFDNAGTICLPITEELQNRSISNLWGMVAGWGKTEYAQDSNFLLKVTVPVRSNEECQKTISFISTSESKRFCAGIQTRDSCDGDSGGPFMLQDSYKGTVKIIQYGIVSGGGKNCGSDMPGVYTNVRYYVKWILDNIRE